MRTQKATVLVVAAAILLCLQASQFGPAEAMADKPVTARELKDIAATAANAGAFGTLIKALDAAGLVDVLKSEGPFTVFAPTDEAFASLPTGKLDELLMPENRDQLTAVLTSHVVPGRFNASQVLALPKLDTVQGGSLVVSNMAGAARVDSAKIVKTDIEASNGIIHVIDSVLVPKDIVETAKACGKFSTLLAAAEAAGLVGALKAEGPLTVFAPTDEAFANLPAGTVEDLLRPANRERLAAILKYHVVPRRILLGRPAAETLQGGSLDIRPDGSFRVDEAQVVVANIRATNGVAHVIDRVLLPDLPEPTPTRKAMAVIELAIERGVPLYNAGKAEACAAIYEVAARSLLDGFKGVLDEKSGARLIKALSEIRRDHRAQSQAWTLRYALDDVYASLRKQAG